MRRSPPVQLGSWSAVVVASDWESRTNCCVTIVQGNNSVNTLQFLEVLAAARNQGPEFRDQSPKEICRSRGVELVRRLDNGSRVLRRLGALDLGHHEVDER